MKTKSSPKQNTTNANAKTPDTTSKKKVVLRGDEKNARQQTDHTPAEHTAKYRMIEPDHDNSTADTSGS